MTKTLSPYARTLDSSNRNWCRDSAQMCYFIAAQQNHCNDRLRAEGILLLNDVFDVLGFTRTHAGCTVGWFIDKDEVSNGYVDFGIFDFSNDGALLKAITETGEYVLDFNVDGPVAHLYK